MDQRFAHYPSLESRAVFVTGGASGIGESLVEHFAAQGAAVKFIDIDESAGQALVARLGGAVRAQFERCDVRDIGALKAAILSFADEHGGLDVLVNNAGSDERHAVESVDPAYWHNRMAVNLDHHFFAAQTARDSMARKGGGSIVNLGSIMVDMAASGAVAYVTAKGAIHAMTRALAREFGPQRIRVNCLVPGWIMTRRQVALYVEDAGLRRIAEGQCLPDALVPADVARMALFLAADDSEHCTSQSFVVDGGWV